MSEHQDTESRPATDAIRPVRSLCLQFPMRGGQYLAQLVVPKNLTRAEAGRLCAFVQSLVTSDEGEGAKSTEERNG